MLRDVFDWKHVDDGDGWLIFALPRTELGVHPADLLLRRDLSLMCDDLETTMAELRAKGIEFTGEPEDSGFGTCAMMLLPGGVEMMLYELLHASRSESAD